MICPYCANDVGFLHFRKHFKCPVCNKGLILKGISGYGIWEVGVSTIVLIIFPIPKYGVISWLVPAFYILLVYFLFHIICAYVEPDEAGN